jgi:hypothetical protein
MSDRIFCNKENKEFDASAFVDGPGDVVIHKTRHPHTTEGWPTELKGGHWVVRQAAVRDSPALRPGDEKRSLGPRGRSKR